MLLALPLLALLFAPTADAGRLIFEKKSPFTVYVWVDGEPLGKIKGKRQHNIELADGEHEIWVAADEAGYLTSCHGMFTLMGSTLVVARNDTCDGVTPGHPATHGYSRGAVVALTSDPGLVAWISIDGADAVALPTIPLELNLAPGGHDIVLYADEAAATVVAQGRMELLAGQPLALACSAQGCEGWGQPTVVSDEPAAVNEEPVPVVDESKLTDDAAPVADEPVPADEPVEAVTE